MLRFDWPLILQGFLLMFLAPGMIGLLRYLEDRLQGRERYPTNLIQPYRDLIKLYRTPAVKPRSTSWLFGVTPMAMLVIYSWLCFLLPVVYTKPFVTADLIIVIYVLGLGRFLFSLAGLDSGAPFSSLGGSREMFLHFITEIGLFLVLADLALRYGTVNLGLLLTELTRSGVSVVIEPSFMLLALAMLILLLFENGRIPIDNPQTHLELTMGHKAMALEFAGRDLAFINWAEMIKFAFFITLFVDLFIPWSPVSTYLAEEISIVPDVYPSIDYFAKMLLVILGLALWEAHRPKLRLRHVIRPGFIAIILSLMAIVYTIATNSGR